MSFEGFYRKLCKAGHLREVDVYECERAEETRCDCGEPFVWAQLVNETNGYDASAYPLPEVAVSAVHCTCPVCGKPHLAAEVRYVVPGNELGPVSPER